MPNRCPIFGRQARVAGPRPSPSKRGYGDGWPEARLKALDRDQYLCTTCGAALPKDAPVDHITPIARGGSRLGLHNLQSLCIYCHGRKTATHDGGFGR